MIHITPEQMAMLDDGARREGNRRLANYIDARFPGILRNLDTEERIALAERYRLKAAAHEFVNDDQIGHYMDLVVMYGPSFFLAPWFAPIMSDSALSANEKLGAIRQLLAEVGVML
jgi:hypothetical protein